MATVDPDDSRPSYRQVADRLRAAIESGKLAPGDQLPTHKALADEFGVAVETAKRALGELRADGLIVTRQGKGSYVRRMQGEEFGIPPETDDVAARVDELSRELEMVKQRLTALETDTTD
jgi:DNA-binding GntR family transcriptional regulator